MQYIRVRGARTHNLKSIDLDLPRDRLIIVTGLSGSGKSSLAFDTLYAEGQRRYVESLSAYARQFLSMTDKADVDAIEGLSPAIAIEQKAISHNPRSTVGTVTEILDYLRLLFARAGIPRCPDHATDLSAQTVSQMVDQILELPQGTAVAVLAPLVSERKGEHAELLAGLAAQGFVRARIDGRVCELGGPLELDARRKHSIEVVVDRLRIRRDAATRLAESLETALNLSGGLARLAFLEAHPDDSEEIVFSSRHACPVCGYGVPPLEPKMFSFNSPAGACPACGGLGYQEVFDPQRVVAHPTRSLAAGAIPAWNPSHPHNRALAESLARHFRFDVHAPWVELAPQVQEVILHGSADERVELGRPGGKGARKREPFEGVLAILERRYRETTAQPAREELSRYRSVRVCPECVGTRLNRTARYVFVGEHSLPEITRLDVGRALAQLGSLKLSGHRGAVARRIVKDVSERLQFLVKVGLEYLTLDRAADSLSGGEGERIRLASQIGSGLTGVMYILDEPSIGLHPRDNRRLLDTLLALRDLGNTVIVVEHDREAMLAADYLVDLGPGAGVHGGALVAAGAPAEIMADPASLTGQYLSERRSIALPRERKSPRPREVIRILGARANNLRNLNVDVPLGLLTCVTGVSGSGKSTLVLDTLFQYARASVSGEPPAGVPCERVEGLERIDRVIDIDQNPIGRTPRSNPATYTGVFAPLRELFAAVPESRARGYGPGRFSFNVKGGRCEACQGDGVIRVEMHFLPDLYVPCDVCRGRRYNRETLEIRYKGHNIHDVLGLTVEDALGLFRNVPAIVGKLRTLADVGLAYLRLGQNATTLSGGEAQRVKLSRELAKRATGRTLYILDEPTTGLHFHDVAQLLRVLERLRDEGNTVVVIEHNLDVIKTADWVIDLGPEAGAGGGRLVACGSPEHIAQNPGSHTGTYLKPLLARHRQAHQLREI